MEFDELLITTGVDALVRLVKEKRKIELVIASQLLDIPLSTLEEWGRVLEEEGILKIEYSLAKKFLVWVEQTPEQIETKSAEFYQEKKGLETEVAELKQHVAPEISEIENLKKDFEQLYNNLYPRLVEFEKTMGELPAKGVLGTEYKDQIGKVQEKISTIESSISSMKTDIAGVSKELAKSPKAQAGVTAGMERFETLKTGFEKLRSEIEELKSKSKQASYAMPSEMPSIIEIKRKFDSLKAELANVKKAATVLRDDFHGLKESSELLGSIRSSIADHEKSIESARTDLKALLKSVADIREKSTRIEEQLKSQVDLANRFADSIAVAKGILVKFPSQKEFSTKLDSLLSAEASLEGRFSAMEKLFSSISAPTMLLTRFDKLKTDVDAKLVEMEKEAESIERAVDEENTAYATFQKIKERAAVSLAAYSSQIKEVGTELAKLRQETEGIDTKVAASLGKFEQKLEQKDVKDMVKLARNFEDKKTLLDQISASIESLSNDAENLNKRLTLLAREAALLDLQSSGTGSSSSGSGSGSRSSSGGGAGGRNQQEREAEVRHQLTLTKSEEEEFRKKRDELRDLIKKLWEDGS